jgi:hypothetical protein
MDLQLVNDTKMFTIYNEEMNKSILKKKKLIKLIKNSFSFSVSIPYLGSPGFPANNQTLCQIFIQTWAIILSWA